VFYGVRRKQASSIMGTMRSQKRGPLKKKLADTESWRESSHNMAGPFPQARRTTEKKKKSYYPKSTKIHRNGKSRREKKRIKLQFWNWDLHATRKINE